MADARRRPGWQWRTGFAALAGVAATAGALAAGVRAAPSALLGWNVAALAFIIPTAWVLFTSQEADVQRRARSEDEARSAMLALVLAAVGAGLGASVVALRDAKSQGGGGGHGAPAWIVLLSISTLVLGWIVVQTLYCLHYTHRYFGDSDNDGKINGGIDFPGDKPKTYKDFIYVAICLGATCQVSDFDITTTSMRNLVTSHAVVAFVFNTMVLALGINIIGNLMGQ